jgi:uncharacterized protein YjiS (DUF1127 family)
MATNPSLSPVNRFEIAKTVPALGERLIETVREWRRRSRSRFELLTLGERDLWDLRLTRIDAVSEASKPFWKQ